MPYEEPARADAGRGRRALSLPATIALGEGALAAFGLAWMWVRGLPAALGDLPRSIVLGIGAALGAAAVLVLVLRYAPDVPGVRGVRRLYRGFFRQVFGQLTPGEIVAISMVAGIGEELFFRGALQAEFGLVPATVAFGVLHVGGRDMIVAGVWAAAIGALLGWLAIASGGLLAPILAHALYDVAAISYVRWGQPRADAREPDGDTRA